MFYTNLSKQSPQPKSKTSQIQQPDVPLGSNSPSQPKNLLVSFNYIIKHKYGRKFVLKQAKQTDSKCKNSTHPLGSAHRCSVEEQRNENTKPKLTLYWEIRQKNIKRHTYNNQCTSSEKDEETENEGIYYKDIDTHRKRNYLISQTSTTQETIKKKCLDKRVWKDRRNPNPKDLDLNETEPERTETHPSQHMKIKGKHNKFASIDLTRMSNEKSLVDLINKFQFQNLKTAHLNSSSSKSEVKQKQKYKYNNNFLKTMPEQKNGPFFKEYDPNNTTYYQEYCRGKTHRTVSKGFRKFTNEFERREQSTARKTSSVLSPWATDGQSLLHSPLE